MKSMAEVDRGQRGTLLLEERQKLEAMAEVDRDQRGDVTVNSAEAHVRPKGKRPRPARVGIAAADYVVWPRREQEKCR
jgi:hypothetical protein